MNNPVLLHVSCHFSSFWRTLSESWMTFALGSMGTRSLDIDHPSSKTLQFHARVDLTEMMSTEDKFQQIHNIMCRYTYFSLFEP